MRDWQEGQIKCGICKHFLVKRKPQHMQESELIEVFEQ